MFQRNKNNYNIVAICRNGDKEGTYEFIENYDECWCDIARDLFYDEYGVEPTSQSLISREKV